MALNAEQQIIDLVNRAKHVLLLTKEEANVDTLASVIAFGLFLSKLNKTFDIAISGWEESRRPSFLPSFPEILPTISAMRTFHLMVNVQGVPLSELMYDVKDGKLDIALVPKQGEWSPSDITFKEGTDRFDLVIVFGCPDMQALGAFAREQASFLLRSTIINIDHHISNEFWGRVNAVDPIAVSTSGLLHNLFSVWNKPLIDSPIATCLLAGMIAETKSFRTPNITPQALSTASELVTLGADREKIIQGLWRTRSIGTLKLWGRALSRLEQDPDTDLVWTRLSQIDFMESGASLEAIHGVMDELLAYAPEAKIIAIFLQTSLTQVTVHLYASPPLSAINLLRPFGGQGDFGQAQLTLASQNINESMQHFLSQLKTNLKNR